MEFPLSDAPALITDAALFSYRELNEKIKALCGVLQAAGVSKGSRVAFAAKTTPDTACLFFALFRLGAVACPFNPRLPKEATRKTIDTLRPALLFDPESQAYSKMSSSQESAPLAVLMLTSGSSAAPKVVALTLQNLLFSAEGSMLKLPLKSQDRWLLPLPLFHVGGLLLLVRAFQKGLAVVISELSASQALLKHRATFLSLVPTQLYRLCAELPSAPPFLKGILIGGAPLGTSLFKEATSRGYKIFTSYGMTEMCAQATLDLSPTIVDGQPTVGTPLPYRKLKLRADGEILVQGETLFAGYWSREEGIHLPLDEEGWFRTNDLGRLTEEGNLLVVGRKDRLFISGGENVSPEEIEKALLSLPGLIEAVVRPHADPEFGHIARAYITHKDAHFSEKELLLQLKTLLPPHLIPKSILPLPPNTAGLKRSLS